MAMDKEILLQRIQAQYLTRQEVLYKLPLNISISTFWPELVERRKLNSTVLPLHGCDGKPLWYVLTDKMVAASEKLCTLALEQASPIDPYRASLTRAMTEELFFTSFVEGARIELNEAMDFLERGNDPESVQEQLIHNNHTAWVDMLRSLYYPLDERMVKMLAYRLTDELDGHATDYRQTDEHVIAAMGNETYSVPAASSLPTLMQEYYAFMASTEVHPLIKAAVGQAFLLITRPFPDGNERLSRMISYTVLLRSGYDFFRDISISSMIAKESFRYYKAMQDIIRSENEGDLTYFIEYYLDLLARSIDAKAEQDHRRQQEALKREREAATQPFRRTVSHSSMNPDAREPVEAIACTEAISASTIECDDSDEAEGSDKPPGVLYTCEEYLNFLHDMQYNRLTNTNAERIERVFTLLQRYAQDGPYSFTRHDWELATGITTGKSKDDIALMVRMKLVLRGEYNSKTATRRYFLPLKEHEAYIRQNTNLVMNAIVNAIQTLKTSEHLRERQMAIGLLDMLHCHKTSFTFAEWIARNPAPNKDVAFGILRVAINHGFITLDNGVYTFAQILPKGPQCTKLPDKQRDVLLQLMDEYPSSKFTIKCASQALRVKPCTLAYYLDNFVQRGLLQVEKTAGNINVYEFAREAHGIFEAVREDAEGAQFRHKTKVPNTCSPLEENAEAG